MQQEYGASYFSAERLDPLYNAGTNRAQLEAEIKVLDPETRRLVVEGALTGASLEFVPLESRTQRINNQDSEVYYRLSPEPEHAGLMLINLAEKRLWPNSYPSHP